MGWLVGGTGQLGTVMWEHFHGLDCLGKHLFLEEKGWRELVGAVVGGGSGVGCCTG